MCKRINIFWPIYLISYILISVIWSVISSVIPIGIPLWLQYAAGEIILLLPPLIYIAVFKINVFKCLPIRKLSVGDAILSLLMGYALIPLVLFLNFVTMLFSTNYLNESSQEITSNVFWVQIIMIAVIPSLVEEFIFRGLFYHSYRRNGIMGAAVVSGLIFGTVHLNINQFCYAFILGIIFALLVEATGSLWASVLTHFAINTFSISMMQLMKMTVGEQYVEQAERTAMNLSAVAVVFQIIFLFCFMIMGVAVAFLLYRCIAKRNGRWEFIKYNVRLGFKPQNGEKFFSVFSIAAFVMAAVFMIFIEYM